MPHRTLACSFSCVQCRSGLSSIAKPCYRDLRTMYAGLLQLLQQHIVPGKGITQFSVSNNQQLPSLLADSPLTVSTLPSLDAR